MTPRAYYNDFEPFVCEWLRNLIKAGLIPDGDVDNRSIRDVRPEDLRGYTQCHFFAGIGGWAYALRLAGWPDDREVWTGSCPCQPFSAAGKQKGLEDDRHLWPEWYRLISACRPSVVFGEQVARAVGLGWLDTVADDLEGEGYAFGAAVLPACAVAAPHERERLWFVADANGAELREQSGRRGGALGSGAALTREHGAAQLMADAPSGDDRIHNSRALQRCELEFGNSGRQSVLADADSERQQVGVDDARSICETGGASTGRKTFEPLRWPAEPDLPRVAHGVPARVAKLRALGNAIVPQVAAEFIGAYLDAAR
jgi:DNA (cytosine-5)-methyltransferase 1